MSDQTHETIDSRASISFAPSPVASAAKPLDLAAARARLEGARGRDYWQSLEELADEPGFHDMIQKEFPGQAPASWAPLERRDFLKLMGASLALAGLAGCARQPQEGIVPFVSDPENVVLGKPLFYATAYVHRGYAFGALAEQNSGRPTKIEGNPDHPVTRGKTNIWMQASVLEMWDPDRSQGVRENAAESTWESFTGAIQGVRSQMAASRGAGVHVLTGTVTSPTVVSQMADLQRRFPAMQWHVWEPAGMDGSRDGVRQATGRDAMPVYNFAAADVVVSLDCDFLLEEPAHLIYARDFISRRRVREAETGKTATMNRLYVAESTPTITGAKADHRLSIRASEVATFASALAGALGGAAGAALPKATGGDTAKFVAAVVKDLSAARGRSLVVAGINQPAAVHALALQINQTLGNIGKTVTFRAPVEAMASGGMGAAGLKRLVDAMNAGSVKSLFILDSNPVFAAPADAKFLDAMKKVPFRAHLGSYFDETAAWCQWHVPLSHPLESWGDARAVDGTATIIQPVIQPLYQSFSAPEVLSALQGSFRKGYEIVKDFWRTQPQARVGGADFEKFWQTALHSGVIPGTAAPALPLTVRSASTVLPTPAATQGIEVQFRPDPTIWDGRYANLGWLQELPKPLTKVAWDNTAQMSPKTAETLGVTTQDVVEIKVGNATVKAPVFIVAGQPDNSVTLHLGFGRERGGRLAEGVGVNVYPLRTTDALWFRSGASVKPTGEKILIACTQPHHNLHGRNHVREATLVDYRKNPTFVNDYEAEFHVGPHHDEAHGEAHSDEGKHATNAGGKHDETKADSTHADIGDSPATGAGKKPPQFKDFTDQQYEFPMHTEGEGRAPVAGYIPGTAEKNKKADGSTVSGNPGNPSHPTLYPQWKYEGYAWGMAVDLQSCIGCQACVVGCIAENNIATVGKDEVLRGREMHWIRIDTYYRGPIENPETSFQPMLCQHCENAPCEPVCPVQATSHSAEGINEMTYNRCIGTRYCSNNCPYKVRRFNFLQYSEQDNPQISLMKNPEVTTRSRGVMEKCNFCVQRVSLARIEAEKAQTRLQDGDVVTACQQACPTDAIIFGDLNDPSSRVSKLKKKDLNYGVLTELNTQPRVTYLAKVTNPSEGLPTFGKPEHDTPENVWEKGE
ncbi:MAG TPA: TAT-variant-translocated molybdopterin oxidoreductase [Abditibacteriaceae bacterium]|jgi:molybdopterin-containing oxidoreductase family iron-sulfur binding subunit